MLKRLILVLAILAAPVTAHADADLAADWGQKATQLYAQTLDMISGEPVPPRFGDDLARFSVTASRLGGWIDSSGGPADLACIFRGMSEEAELQLGELDIPTRRADALRRLATLFYDAESMAVAAIYAHGRDSASTPATAGVASCHAQPQAALQYFTEQP